MRKKAFTLLLVAALCLGLMPTDVLAEGMEASETTGEEIAGTAVQAAGVTVEGENAETVVTVEEEDPEEPSGDPETISEDESEVETEADWEATLPQDLTGIWSEDVVAVAKSQLGYTESEEGYTRYGAWYGNESDDWDAMFVSFCLHYAEVPESEFPQASGAYAWITALKEAGQEDEADDQELYADVAAYVPEAGDLVFLDTDADGKADHVGIVEKVETKGTDAEAGEEASEEAVQKVTVIEGDSNDAVEEKEYDANGEDISDGDATITGYGVLPIQEDAENEEEEDADIAELAWTGDASGKVVLNLGNGNGKYNFADYAGNKDAGTDLRYTTDSLTEYAADDGTLTINLPSDNDLDKTFTVVDGVTVALGNCEAYDYKLVGWENIATGEYYDVSGGATTATINLNNENVFYADWIAASYDHGSETDTNLRDDIVSTKGFVTMHMYDYNELYNLYSESLVQNGTDSEEWTDSGNLYNALPYPSGNRLTSSFIFVNDGTTAKTAGDGGEATGGMLSWPTGKTAGNSWTGSGAAPRNATEIWGIESPYSAPMDMLFDPEASAVGVHYVGEADYLFWLDDNGYYTYNSKEAAATYNQTDQCFYVYDGTQSVSNTEFSCFLPYNTYGDELSAVDGSVNYWFGMDMEVNFYLPNATGTEGGNQSESGEDMVFNFSGDDDILIFVDDELVLDMSGIHDESFGSINFADGTVKMAMTETGLATAEGSSISLSAGAHDLKVYYMERGGYASNLEIQFNVAALWEYESGDVQTITAEKTWVDAQGNVIDPENLPDAYKENGVEVGLFDVLGPATEDTFGYTQNGDTYTVEYTDDSGVTRTYEYDASGPTLTYTEVDSEGKTIVDREVDNNTDSEGRVIDSEGYVVAWLDGENLYIRIDKQTLSDANGWYYAWELLDPEAIYEVLELSSSSSYTTTSTKENLLRYEYWSIIGDSQIENSFEAGETLQVILTEAAQEASNTLGNTKDAMGWVIVATDSGITTQRVEFSQIAELQEIKDESSGQTSYKTIAGVTSKSEIDALGSGAIWYVIDAEKQTEDLTGNELEDFYLYCVLDGTQYYLVLQGTTLTVTSDSSAASTFCYDSLGELLVVMADGGTERVEIQADGTITIGDAELVAAIDDIRIFTLQETETSGFAFTAVNTFAGKDVDADGDGEYGDSGEEVKVGDTLTYKIDYFNSYQIGDEGYEDPATVTITDVLDEGLDYVSSDPEAEVSINDEGRTVLTWTIEGVEAQTGGSVTFTATVNSKALVEDEVNNVASVQINNDEAIDTNFVHNPVPDKGVDVDGDEDYGDSGEEVKVGDTLTYKIDYFNGYEIGDEGYEDPATVTITDVLDEGLDYVSSDPEADVSTNDEGRTVLTWTIEDVKAQTGGSVTFTATVNSKALIEDEVNNVASVQINNDEAVDTNFVHNPVPDKDVDADGDGNYGDSGLLVKVGDTLTYKIDYFNGYEIGDEGYEDPATVTITDVLDEGLDYVSSDPEAEVSINDEGRTVLTWTIEDVKAQSGGSVTFTATVNENALVKNEVENTASVQIDNDAAIETNTVYNPVPEKDEDVDEDETYGDSGRAVEVGTKITFTIKYRNTYDDPATVTITDVLDEGLDYVSSDPEADVSTNDEGRTVLTWVITNVEAHTSGSVQFTAVVNENALTGHQVENTASVQIGDHPAKNTNTVYNPLTSKDVDIHGDGTYGDSGLQVKVGDTLTYIVYYMNSYDDPATVTITDVLDEGLDFVKASEGGTYDEDTRTITWVLENVPGREDIPEEGLSVTFEATVNENALVKHEVDNTATVQVNDDPSVNTNTVYNPVPEKSVDADGDNTYDDNGDEVSVGDTLYYKIDYFNGYDDPSTVTITDVLDEGVDFDSASDEGVYDEETHTVTWTIEEVEPHTGGFVILAVVVNKNALEVNEVKNTATVQVGNDAVVTNEVDNTVTGKDVDADGDGEYGDSGVEVKVGDTLEYIIYYDNGYDYASTVTITDELDESLDYVAESASNGGVYDESTRTITWELGEIAAHTAGSVTFKVTVNENAWVKGEVENTGSVQVGPHDPKVTNTVYNPTPHKDVDIHNDDTFGDSGLQVKVGDTLTYKIEYFNGEEDEPADVTITDVLDKGLDFVSADNGGTYDEATRTITWVINDVPAQTGGNVTFTATVNEDALEKNEVDNTAKVAVDGHPEVETNTVYNPVPGKGVDTDEDQEYDDNGEEVQVGDTLEYKIDYMNSNDVSATVTITDELDEGLDFVEASNDGTYNESNRTITWVIEDVEAHTGGSVTFKATVNRNALEVNEVKNTATVKVDNDAVVTNEVDNPVPDKGVDTDGDGEYDDDGEYVKIGDTLTYIITYDNADSVPVTVTITDTLDQGLDYVEGSASNGGTYDDSTRTITWVINDVPAHTAGSVTFKATVNENVTEKYEVDNTAYVKVGTHEAVETNKVENPYRQYFPIDEEIVPDEDDPSTWVKEESVNEYNAIELEMTTQLPIIEPAALADGQFMMYFHNKLDHELVLDETTTDFKVYIGGTEISTDYYKITFDDETGDDCNFHVDVDLTALYKDGIVTADMLDGNTDITIYFFADLEGTDLNGSYTSTVWYDVYDGEDWEYTSNEDVVTVYTYEIKIQKVDENGDPLAGAEFGIYYDKECQEPVYRTYGSVFDNNQSSPYVVTSDADGMAIFYGLAEGTYYVKELSAPIGYVVSNEVIEIELNADTTDEDHVYSTTVENTPSNPDEPEDPVKGVDTDGDGDFNDNHLLVKVGDELTYRIWYYNYNDEAVTVTVTDTLDEALDFVSATDGGVYDESNRTITWTIENVPAKTVGYVDFKATVNEKAQEKGKVENTGSVKIGNDDFVNTNTVENPVESESEGGGNPTPGTGNPKSGTSTPKTSDTNNIALWLVLLIAAMAAVIVALRMKKRS